MAALRRVRIVRRICVRPRPVVTSGDVSLTTHARAGRTCANARLGTGTEPERSASAPLTGIRIVFARRVLSACASA